MVRGASLSSSVSNSRFRRGARDSNRGSGFFGSNRDSGFFGERNSFLSSLPSFSLRRKKPPPGLDTRGTLDGVRLTTRAVRRKQTRMAARHLSSPSILLGVDEPSAGTAVKSPCSLMKQETLRFLRCSQITQSVDFEEVGLDARSPRRVI